MSSNSEDLLPLKDLPPTVLQTESPGSKGNRKSTSPTGQPEHTIAPCCNTRQWDQTGAWGSRGVGGTVLRYNMKGFHPIPGTEGRLLSCIPQLSRQINPRAVFTAPCSFSLNQEGAVHVARDSLHRRTQNAISKIKIIIN